MKAIFYVPIYRKQILPIQQLQTANYEVLYRFEMPKYQMEHNLVKNGDADCNITLVKDWQVENGSIAVVASKEDPSDCQFSLQSLVTEATMSQRIVQAQFWNSFICTNSIVKLQANMSSGVSIELSGINSARTILNKIVASKLRR
jgi:hypothetical protein